jgi:hypothetical protein
MMSDTLDERANTLAREAIKAVAELHAVRKMASPRNWHCSEDLQPWPCATVTIISEAEEAISEAEERGEQ